MKRIEAMAMLATGDPDLIRQHLAEVAEQRQEAADVQCALSAHGHADIVLESGERPTCRNCGREPSPEQLASWCGKTTP